MKKIDIETAKFTIANEADYYFSKHFENFEEQRLLQFKCGKNFLSEFIKKYNRENDFLCEIKQIIPKLTKSILATCFIDNKVFFGTEIVSVLLG